jgi:hypothetical protein
MTLLFTVRNRRALATIETNLRASDPAFVAHLEALIAATMLSPEEPRRSPQALHRASWPIPWLTGGRSRSLRWRASLTAVWIIAIVTTATYGPTKLAPVLPYLGILGVGLLCLAPFPTYRRRGRRSRE